MKKINMQFLSFLHDGEYHTIQQISKYLDTNYKNVQAEVKIANSIFAEKNINICIENKHGKGIRLIDDGNVLSELINNSELFSNRDIEEDSYKDIIFNLLNNDYISLDTLCEQFSTSRTVMLSHIKKAKATLEKHKIAIMSRPHYGYYVQGTELCIQKFLYSELVNETVERRCRLCRMGEQEYALLSEKVISIIKNIIIDINDSEIDTVLIWLQIFLLRGRSGKHQEENKVKHSIPENYRILTDKIFELLENQTGSYNNSEKNWIHMILASFDHKNEYYDDSIQISEKLLTRIFEKIKEKYNFDFSHDIELYTSLRQHLCALIKRGRLNIFSRNPISHQVKSYFAFPYEIAVEIALIIYQETSILINDDEISYLAIYFHLAMERKTQAIQQKRVLVVCPSGNSVSQLMTFNIKNKFSEYISDVRTCGLSDLEKIDFNEIDYVFSCFPIESNIPVPVIYLPLEVRETSTESLKVFLQGANRGYSLLNLTNENMFFGNLPTKDKETSIHQIINKIKQIVPVNENFEKSVLDRENLFTTEIDNYVAFPHPLIPFSSKTFISVSVLKKPIIWKDKKVQVIFLGSVAEGEGENMKKYYQQFTSFITNEEYISRLINVPEYDTFKKICIDIEKKYFEKGLVKEV